MQVTRLSRQGLRVYRLFRAANIEEAVAVVRKNILPDATGWQDLGDVSSALQTHE